VDVKTTGTSPRKAHTACASAMQCAPMSAFVSIPCWMFGPWDSQDSAGANSCLVSVLSEPDPKLLRTTRWPASAHAKSCKYACSVIAMIAGCLSRRSAVIA
jgi:hypothetical protein